ncbi:hypothetical protein RHMOL_Rhmol10G0302900 [Rhododendron molle]|uniref:Uncharacterized protein n=1 Tax=Rhododendron molle TaxID=49168 RepID=A0ACC0M8V7_RHOML|nr:hypothetical protein RHMOL_Rhmol10G0302900 [Rhododendron molle]
MDELECKENEVLEDITKEAPFLTLRRVLHLYPAAAIRRTSLTPPRRRIMEVESSSNLPLPDAFLDFLNENGLDPSVYTNSDPTPRYVRLKPGCEGDVEEIEVEVGCKLEKVDWLPSFYSLSPHVQIANSKGYQQEALNISLGDHVLDLCVAPGAKLCMILDLLGSSGSVTGIDVARHRLAACRTLVLKSSLGDRCRLFVADGTLFSLLPITVFSGSNSGEYPLDEMVNLYKEWTSRRPWKDKKKAAKARVTVASQLTSSTQDPELIYYGKNSGVVGLTRSEIYQTFRGNDVLRCGYDKIAGINQVSKDFAKRMDK